jgi:hypothetical protein
MFTSLELLLSAKLLSFERYRAKNYAVLYAAELPTPLHTKSACLSCLNVKFAFTRYALLSRITLQRSSHSAINQPESTEQNNPSIARCRSVPTFI